MKIKNIGVIAVGVAIHFFYFLIFTLQFFGLLGFIPFPIETPLQTLTTLSFLAIAVYFWVKFCKGEFTLKKVILYAVSIDIGAIILMILSVLIGRSGLMPEQLIPLLQFNSIMFFIVICMIFRKNVQS